MKKTLILVAILFSFLSMATVKAAGFADLSPDSEFYTPVMDLVDAGVIEGYEDNTFQSDRPVSRAEFLKMAYLTQSHARNGSDDLFPFDAVESVVTDPPCFADVNSDHWFAPHICWGKSQDLLEGYLDGNFLPHDTVNVVEAAKMMLKYQSYDYTEEAHWALGYLENIAPHGLPLSVGSPSQELTRGEATHLLWAYYLATDEDLKEIESTLLLWDGDKFLNTEYIGMECHYAFCTLYAEEKTAQKIYAVEYNRDNYFASEVEGADPITFKVIEGREEGEFMNIAYDAFSLYYFGKPVEGSAGGQFIPINDQVLHTNDAHINYAVESYPYFFFKDNKFVYSVFCYEGCWLRGRLTNSDSDSFKYLENMYAKDDNNAYFFYNNDESRSFQDVDFMVINEADPATFERVDYPEDGLNPCRSQFAKDDTTVFFRGEVLDGIDAESFEIIQLFGFFFKDKNGVYTTIHTAKGPACQPDDFVLLEGVDPDDFEPVGSGYFISDDTVHFVSTDGKVSVSSADPDTFENYSIPEDNMDFDIEYQFDGMGHDDEFVYYQGKLLNGVDLETFSFAERGRYWEDKNDAFTPS